MLCLCDTYKWIHICFEVKIVKSSVSMVSAWRIGNRVVCRRCVACCDFASNTRIRSKRCAAFAVVIINSTNDIFLKFHFSSAKVEEWLWINKIEKKEPTTNRETKTTFKNWSSSKLQIIDACRLCVHLVKKKSRWFWEFSETLAFHCCIRDLFYLIEIYLVNCFYKFSIVLFSFCCYFLFYLRCIICDTLHQ